MSKVKLITRILLGFILLVFGLNKFLEFMPMPPLTPEAGEFMGALVKTGYMMPIVAVVEIITGLLILFNKYLPLALIIAFPVILNAFLFHLFLDVSGIGGAALTIILLIYQMVTQKKSYQPLFIA